MKRSPLKIAKDNAWNIFSKYIRLSRSENNGYCRCVTCGKRAFWEKDGMQAGHFIPTRNNSVLINEDLVYPQCYSCNCGADKGKPFEFTKYMLSIGFTMEELDNFNQLKHKTKKMIKEDWDEICHEYKQKFADLLVGQDIRRDHVDN